METMILNGIVQIEKPLQFLRSKNYCLEISFALNGALNRSIT